jgi:hypothetical protein
VAAYSTCPKCTVAVVSLARRCAHCLTPPGFTERWRLGFEFMSLSFTLFRQAKADCKVVLNSVLKIPPTAATAGVRATSL